MCWGLNLNLIQILLQSIEKLTGEIFKLERISEQEALQSKILKRIMSIIQTVITIKAPEKQITTMKILLVKVIDPLNFKKDNVWEIFLTKRT